MIWGRVDKKQTARRAQYQRGAMIWGLFTGLRSSLPSRIRASEGSHAPGPVYESSAKLCVNYESVTRFRHGQRMYHSGQQQ